MGELPGEGIPIFEVPEADKGVGSSEEVAEPDDAEDIEPERILARVAIGIGSERFSDS